MLFHLKCVLKELSIKNWLKNVHINIRIGITNRNRVEKNRKTSDF
jgi:hypothetical protein